jgi:hypothetical protein
MPPSFIATRAVLAVLVVTAAAGLALVAAADPDVWLSTNDELQRWWLELRNGLSQ